MDNMNNTGEEEEDDPDWYFNQKIDHDAQLAELWKKSFEDYNRRGNGKIIWLTYKDVFPPDMEEI